MLEAMVSDGRGRVISFGEAMIRFAPQGSSWDSKAPSAVKECLRSVGGDEMNVCVALSRLGREATWASVLPKGPLGEVVRRSGVDAGVCMDLVVTDEKDSAEMGVFYVLPEEGRVHYQRRHSSFAVQRPGLFDWSKSLGGASWLHLTGITPMLGEGCASNWVAAAQAAGAAQIPISVDLNYRPGLGTFEALWSITQKVLGHVHLLILSVHSAHILAAHLGVTGLDQPGKKSRVNSKTAGAVAAPGESDTGAVVKLLEALHEALGGPALACCLKERDSAGSQRRWSVMVDGSGLVSTENEPTLHKPRDECGGGSAWAAGVIDFMSQHTLPAKNGGTIVLGRSQGRQAALRRGDVLAALSQETVGDHCAATRAQLEAVERSAAGKVAIVGDVNVAESAVEEAAARVSAALERLKSAKVIAILRAKNVQRAAGRAVELADMGYRAIEVTADSAGFNDGTLLNAVVEAVGSRCLVGVGTITTPEQLATAAAGGAHFALSPVRPTVGFGEEGFVRACHRLGVLAMPAAFTPQEIYECVEAHGAHTVKIFPSQLWNPNALKDLRRIGNYGKYLLCPSGGVDCKSAVKWLEAGATAVGMGSCLVGKDVATDPSNEDAMKAAEEEWLSKAKPEAERLAKELALK